MRTENGKTLDLGGGTRRLESHIGAIHYKDTYDDPRETWKDIDLTWEGNRITRAPYELTLDGKRLTLKDKKTGEISTIELLESKPAGLEWEIIAENSAVRFRHILPSDKIPFEAKFQVTGKILFRTHAFDDEGDLPLETTFVDGTLTEKVSSLPRPAKGNIRIDPTWQVGASSDDTCRSLIGDYWNLAGVNWEVGYETVDYYKFGGGGRFTNVTIPKGSTILGAYLTLRCQSSCAGTIVRTRISAENVDDAPTFADDKAAFDARWANRTTARMNWDGIPAWTAGTDYDSPTTDGTTTFASIIQEVINRAGWASGNDIVIFWDDFDGRSDSTFDYRYRAAYSYDGSTTYAPKLVVTYTLPPGKAHIPNQNYLVAIGAI